MSGLQHPWPASRAAMFTDHYELTMVQAALADGTAQRHCVFEVFSRRLPPGRRYGVLAGTGRVLEALHDFHFAPDDLEYLSASGVVDAATIEFLAGYRFTGTITGYAEGECFFPGSPVLVVEGPFAQTVLLETLVLSILNFDSAVASAASRMTCAAGQRSCVEMGSRRTHEHAAVAAARAAVIGGFTATSNLAAGQRYGLTTAGTAAHAFTLLHDDERSAFVGQVAAMGTGTTLLVDTYDVATGVATAVQVAGRELGAVRLDSGDLPTLAGEVRAQLDALGATGTNIVVTSDLDEYAIAALAAAPVDSYGVGTSVVTGSGAPTCGMVYKLVARQSGDGAMLPVAKASTDKQGVGGRKTAARRLDPDREAVQEVVLTGSPDDVERWLADRADLRPLHVPLVVDGAIDRRRTGPAAVRAAADRHLASRGELPRAARRLSAGEAAIPTAFVAPGGDRSDPDRPVQDGPGTAGAEPPV